MFLNRRLRRIFSFLVLMAAFCPAVLLAQEPAATAKDAVPVAASNSPSLAEVVDRLGLESRAKFGELLAADWKDRPEWADMLIGILKNDKMSATFGWFKPSAKKYDWNWLAERFDADKDGVITKDELPSDTPNHDKLFARLDRDNNGKLQASDFNYARQPQTPPGMMSQFLASLLDQDSNGRITPEELQDFLKHADQDEGGFLTMEDLFRDFSQAYEEQQSGGDDMPGPEKLLKMFFGGELGVFDAGPQLGAEAPDFTLPTHDATQTITLSQRRGKPVILIFGSFT